MPDITAGQSPKGGETAARFRLLYVTYDRRLRAYIAARLGRHATYDLIEDLARETWKTVSSVIDVWPLHVGRPRFGWLAGIARRVIITHVHHHRAEQKVRAARELTAGRRRGVSA